MSNQTVSLSGYLNEWEPVCREVESGQPPQDLLMYNRADFSLAANEFAFLAVFECMRQRLAYSMAEICGLYWYTKKPRTMRFSSGKRRLSKQLEHEYNEVLSDKRTWDLIMGKPGNTGFIRIIHATRYSLQGFSHAWNHEAAFRQEIALTLILAPVGIWLGQSALERTILIACCLFVLVVELLNSAVEAAIDRHGQDHHELSGRAKDLGSAAVMLSLLLAASVWIAFAYQRFFS